ncbi:MULTISPECIES: hypothetical protein [Peribacillus]|uniref:hypothetical protein n=1 Tax=Peribacillus TaxID=2675229 RepID=UPI001F4D6A39|nr:MULTISPECIES: hypothetical protein [unclassified Peribacillus]MCK1985171.1 hypothetical protein [Peribacillus sp. Aquil_B1]MCK2007179.1 hypothetical protein [Peribacillus sp. Aquil_B8]
MALIPLNQYVTIIRQGEADEWGEHHTPPNRIRMKCNLNEDSQLVQNQIGKEVVAGMEIIFDKLADIRYEDQIEYTNELNQTITRSPIRITPQRMINGKVVQTAVFA